MNEPMQLGIIGWPVKHSASPPMHEAAGKALSIPLSYTRYATAPDQLSTIIATLVEKNLRGFNVTVPHKLAVVPLLKTVSAQAKAIGAVNTVVIDEGELHGHNTDGIGLLRSLREAGASLENQHAVLIGAGGAARAAVAGLAEGGVASIDVFARRVEQATELCDAIEPAVGCELRGKTLDVDQPLFEKAALIVQATSATLIGNPASEAFADSLPWDSAESNAAVVDLVYKPRNTSVLNAAAKRGLHTIDGLGMLLHQGAAAFELWTKRDAPIDVMRKALEDAISAR